MRYLLDTSVLISLSKRREPTFSWVHERARSGDILGTCDIVVSEFLSGIHPSDRPVWDAALRQLTFWVVTYDVARQAGIYRYVHARQGTSISTEDAIIAAVALDANATLVTGNLKHFPMPELNLMKL